MKFYLMNGRIDQFTVNPLLHQPGQGVENNRFNFAGIRRIQVGTEPLIIGRSPQCEIQVDQESVSRNHCRIRFTGSEFLVRDLGSTNGTYVDGVRITTEKRTPVSDGARLRHGRFDLA